MLEPPPFSPEPPPGAPVEALVFDLFDTLVDLDFAHLPLVEVGGRRIRSTYPDLHAVVANESRLPFAEFAERLAAVDREIAEAIRNEGREVSTRERFARLAERMGIDDPAAPERLTRIHMRRIREGASAPAAHAVVLARLRSRFRVGLCSNFSDAETALEILDATGLGAHLDAVAISETVGHRKPRAEPFLAVLRDLGVEPEGAVHVGDRLVDDVLGASALGMRTAWAVRRVTDPEAHRRLHPGASPTWVVRHLDELPALFDRYGR